MILPIFSWGMKKAPDYPEIKKDLEDLQYRSLLKAAQEDNVSYLKEINQFTKGISKKMANDLLWHIIKTGKGITLIPELKKIGVDLEDARNGVTPLIQAVRDNKQKFVEQLLASGANLDAIVDPEVGSALQQAIEKRHVMLELYLRNKGAHE